MSKKRIQELKDNKICVDCQTRYRYWILQFDHVLGKKEFNISRIGRTKKISNEELLKEISKCELVCANCHAERSYNRSGKKMELEKKPFKRIRFQTAIKNHICNKCSGFITPGQSYLVSIEKIGKSIKHTKSHTSHCPAQDYSNLRDELKKDNDKRVEQIIEGPIKEFIDTLPPGKIITGDILGGTDKKILLKTGRTCQKSTHIGSVYDKDSNVLPSFVLEAKSFVEFLKSLYEFHRRWGIAITNTIEDRKKIMLEEVEELYNAIKNNDLENVQEELADNIAIAFGNVLWFWKQRDYPERWSGPSFSIYSILNYITEKLTYRAKFGYLIRNKISGQHKATHFAKVVNLLKNRREEWEVISGPKDIHPEIKELLTSQEIEKLEKMGV